MVLAVFLWEPASLVGTIRPGDMVTPGQSKPKRLGW